jgi:protein-tyrosine-phosphatase
MPVATRRTFLQTAVAAAAPRPLVLTRRRLEWQIPDPKEMPPERFREVRHLIEAKVKELLRSL